MSSSEWTLYKLGELGSLARGKSKYRPRDATFLYGGKYPFIQTGDVKAANHKITAYTQTYSDAGLAQSKLWPAGTIAITIAANIADTGILTFPACFPDSVLGFISDEKKCNIDFIEYLLQFYRKRIQQHAIGSVQDNINLGTFENVEFLIPPITTQRRIADILSSLDEKIELNRQTNATLESIAQAIFKEWFVDFNFPGATGEMVESELGLIPSGWRVGKLGDICKYVRKGIHPKDIASDTPYVGLEHIPRKSLGLASWGFSEDVDSQKTYFKKYDVLFGKLRPYFHKVCIAPVDGICSTDILVIEPNHYDYFSFCLNYLFSDELITYVSLIADGTRMPRIDWDSISNYQILIPNHELLKEFTRTTFPLYDSIILNNQESATLAALRDSLLPKLMSGEMEV